MTDAMSRWAEGLGHVLRVGGAGAALLLAVGAAVYFASVAERNAKSVEPLLLNLPDRYPASQAAADWKAHAEVHLSLVDQMRRLQADLTKHEAQPYHNQGATDMASMKQQLTDVIRRLDRIEAKLER